MTAAPSIKVLTWHGCYDDSWRGLIVPEAFSHPAKFAPGLIVRIYRHGVCEGWWERGDTVGDPFGGIAGGGVFAGYAGLNWIGVELEARFVELGNRNLAVHAPKWHALDATGGVGASRVTLVQGDSRRFADTVGRVVGIVTSPPYADSIHDRNGIDATKFQQQRFGRNTQALGNGYGDAVGQIGRLPDGSVDAVVTSPPYSDGLGHGGGRPIHQPNDQTSITLSGQKEGYGGAAGQIGELSHGAIDGVVTSPPYEGLGSGGPDSRPDRLEGSGASVKLNRESYGSTEGQIGREAGETYWQAMHQVYGQCLLAIRPGGVMAVVVKDYVKDRARVPLCDHTLRLLVHLGFEPVVRIRAMLVKESEHTCLFGHRHVSRRERKSFFRRLAEKKGSPRIDWEEVLVVRKAGGGA